MQTKLAELNFTGANNGYKVEVREADDGYSFFRWCDTGTGVYLWREQHGLTWSEAFAEATKWLKYGG